MSKIAKRMVPATTTRAKAGALRSLPARRTLGAGAGDMAPVGAGAGAVIEGHVVSAGAPGRSSAPPPSSGPLSSSSPPPPTIRAVLVGGEAIEALCPAHIDAAWLKEACARGPVAAVFVVARPSGRHVLWGLFPGAEHADVRADVVIRGRAIKLDAESLHLGSRHAHLRLDPEGDVALKGRDVTSHARRVNRIRGGSIRLN